MSTRMSADVSVIICISNESCAQIETVAVEGAGRSDGLGQEAQSGVPAAAAIDSVDPGAARASGENFPVALRMLPARPRQHLMAVYGRQGNGLACSTSSRPTCAAFTPASPTRAIPPGQAARAGRMAAPASAGGAPMSRGAA